MKYCLKCNNQIKYLVEINGKIRNLQRRKYCLDCSPFGSKNTKQLVKPDNENSTRNSIGKNFTCKDCGKEFTYKKKGDKTTRCQVCCNKEARKQKKKKCLEYKGGKCESCGYNKCDKALVFHHIDPKQKEFQISSFPTKNWEAVKSELDKCKLLCANCHAEVHDRIGEE